jgi:phosphoglycolate phosphatase
MLQHPKLIIFDLDGTLVDAYKAVSRSLNFALGQVGIGPVPDPVIKRKVGRGDRNLVGNFVPPLLVDKTLRIYRRHHQKALREGTEFLPGAKRLIHHLRRQGYLLAIASNRPTRFTRIILKHLKVLQCFDCVLCADKVKRPKPYPDMLLGIMNKLNVLPAEAVYVGDMTIDVATGKKARVRTIAVATGSSTKAELLSKNPDRIISKVREMLK